jgi:F0F1-type ATP synthase membrane subunit b/b'
MHIPPDWGTFFALIVSFLVFWFIFSRLFFRPFLDLLAKRERRFKELNDRSEELIKQARAADEEREARLAAVRQRRDRRLKRS